MRVSDTARAAVEAEAAGADGVMVLPPLQYNADIEELVAFFAELSAVTALPTMLYNNPGGSRNDMSPDDIVRVRNNARIDAVKECSGDARRIAEILRLTNNELPVLVGGDDWVLEGIAAGATGWVSGCANVIPRECAVLVAALRDDNFGVARSLYQSMLPLARLDMHPKLVQFYKAGMDLSGRYGGPTRPPRLALNPNEMRVLEIAMESIGSREQVGQPA